MLSLCCLCFEGAFAILVQNGIVLSHHHFSMPTFLQNHQYNNSEAPWTLLLFVTKKLFPSDQRTKTGNTDMLCQRYHLEDLCLVSYAGSILIDKPLILPLFLHISQTHYIFYAKKDFWCSVLFFFLNQYFQGFPCNLCLAFLFFFTSSIFSGYLYLALCYKNKLLIW